MLRPIPHNTSILASSSSSSSSPASPLRPLTARRACVIARATSLTLIATTETATRQLARHLSRDLRRGDAILLYGDVGAGKSAFCRALLRAVAEDPYLPVPSPTFLLVNPYEDISDTPIMHYDLYRLQGPKDVARLGLPDAFSTAVSLVEWAERLSPSPSCPEGAIPLERLEITVRAVPKTQQAAMAGALASSAPSGGKTPAWAVAALASDDSSGEWEEDEWEEDPEGPAAGWRSLALEAHGARWEGALGSLRAALVRRDAQPTQPTDLLVQVQES